MLLHQLPPVRALKNKHAGELDRGEEKEIKLIIIKNTTPTPWYFILYI
jgi:hypothetical protein